MNQEDKELLHKDLCTRLPYNTMIRIQTFSKILNEEVYYTSSLNDHYLNQWCRENLNIRPYLFPMSSMTEEQKKEYYSLADDVTIEPGLSCRLGIKIHCIKLGISDNPHEEVWDYIDLNALDWLNKNHFDYRGLIEKGLAIDATGLNIY